MVGSKQPSAVFLTPEQAENHCRAGLSVWKFASTDDGLDPDVIIVGIGAELTFEVIAAADLLKQKIPEPARPHDQRDRPDGPGTRVFASSLPDKRSVQRTIHG
jgi:XFP C-terminal domain